MKDKQKILKTGRIKQDITNNDNYDIDYEWQLWGQEVGKH